MLQLLPNSCPLYCNHGGYHWTYTNCCKCWGVPRAGGKTEALSFDHKSQQDREMDRIHNAGRFVNQFGRVNGNLNLSRSIGDLKYKQFPGTPQAGQMDSASK
jgi:serine/threonine protein phosphatase PrpC